jgi:cephalosporin hydroxylase
MTPEEEFAAERERDVAAMAADEELQTLTQEWFDASCRYRYSYNFTWLGRPLIQFPQDIVAMQELIWNVRPQLVIETGIAHGGSLVLYASILELIGDDGRVLGIDIDIREHNRRALEAHPLASRIDLLEGSSVDDATLAEVGRHAEGKRPVLVVLDSNHTHEHVLRELELYSPLVTKGSYLVVFDTVIERMAEDAFPDRPWSRGNSPWTAVEAFLEMTDRFVVDSLVEQRLLVTVAPNGYLRCVED